MDITEKPDHIVNIDNSDNLLLKEKIHSRGKKLQRLMQLAKVTEVRASNEQFEQKIQELTPEGALRYLETINGILRGIKNTKEQKPHGGRVAVGHHNAPRKNIQEWELSQTIDAIKEIKDNHHRATLAYYTVNNLHYFGDGNGRTARAVYEIFENQNFNLDDIKLEHQTDAQNEKGSSGKFEYEHNIASARCAYDAVSNNIIDGFMEKNLISPKLSGVQCGIEYHFDDELEDEIYLTEDAEKNLSVREKNELNFDFNDEWVSFISLILILRGKNKDEAVINAEKKMAGNDEYFYIDVYKQDPRSATPTENQKSPITFEDWKAEDYRKFLQVYERVQHLQQLTMIDCFKNPDKYKKAKSGRTFLDYFCHHQG